MVNGVGRTNGLVNGVGRTNGLVNGKGRTNGLTNGLRDRTKGLANGVGLRTGLVNGIGYTNGVRLRRSTYGIVASSDYRRTAAFIAGSVVAMLLLGYFLGVPEPVPSPFAVDGDFSEWAGVAQYADPVDPVPAHLDLEAFALHPEPGRLFVYGRTRGPMPSSNETASAYVLIDDPASTGYAVQGSDVDFYAEAWGWSGRLQQTTFFEWAGDPDRDNATSFRHRGPFNMASSGSEFELVLTDALLATDPAMGLTFTVVMRSDVDVDQGVSVRIPSGALSVVQRPLVSVVSTTTDVLELRLRGHAVDIEVRGFSFDQTGGGTVVVPSLPLVVPAGQERTVQIALNPTGAVAGSYGSLGLRSVNAVPAGGATSVPVTVGGPAARMYIQSPPAGFTVDGIFTEWSSVTADPDDPLPGSIDITESAFTVPTDAFFYVRTEGDILAGALLPERRVVPPVPAPNGTTPGPFPIQRKSAEDILRMYIDSDDGDPVGYTVGGISADRLVEIHGRSGRITSRGLYGWNDATWAWDPRLGAVDVEFVGGQLEASVPASFFGGMNNPRVVFAMTDWAFRSDITDFPTPATSPSLRLSPSPLHALPLPDEVDATALTSLVAPVIDGNCASFAGEYSGGTVALNSVIAFVVGRRDASQFVYICIRVTADTARSGNDWGEVIFDTLHNGGATPQVDDKLFWVFGCTGSGCDTSLSAWQGNGAGWNFSCPTCDPGNAGASRFSTFMWYEFRVRYTDVWGTLLPAPGQIAGFAIIAYDFNLDVLNTWGGPAVDENVPSSWGHLYYPIPEFPLPALAVLPVVLIPVLRWRRSRSRSPPSSRVKGISAPRESPDR